MEDIKKANLWVAFVIVKGEEQPLVEIPAKGASLTNLPHHRMIPKEHVKGRSGGTKLEVQQFG